MKEQKDENNGTLIVLTASDIDFSDFKLNPFIAFTGGFPSGVIPKKILRKYWYPLTESNEDGSAKFAPYGLRKVEVLLKEEFGDENVVTCTQYNLKRFIGKNTRVIGISTMDPVGIGFVSRTYTSLVAFGKEPISAMEFKDLITNPAIKNANAKIIVGGSGAWQIKRAGLQDFYGITTLVIGESESVVTEIFRRAVNDEHNPKVVEPERPRLEQIPVMKEPALYGVVEITRGCGKGCQFCSPTMRSRHTFPLDKIKKEAELNAKAGAKMITLQTDDIFIYKCKPRFVPNREAIVELIKTIYEIPNVEYIQIAHSSLPPVVYDPKMIEEIAPMLVEKTRWQNNGKKVSCPEIGIETGSIRLLEKYMRGKALPYEPKDWHEIVTQGLGILNDNDIYPLATLLAGLPDEREEDTLATMELLDKMKHLKLFYVPLLFTSEEECLLNEARQAELKDLKSIHWDFIATCWRRNIDLWAPKDKWKIMLGALFGYYFYYRWKHGSKILRPILRLSGYPESFFLGVSAL
ncbi:MAG: radical SAM protein [Candidatus Thermoplasmatota archaeon]|nr:radical SAM protein [Candidatus Thermoplasmatota archaeon]